MIEKDKLLADQIAAWKRERAELDDKIAFAQGREVVPEQRGDSTNEQGRADAVDGDWKMLAVAASKAIHAHQNSEFNSDHPALDAVCRNIDRAIAAEIVAQGAHSAEGGSDANP